MSSDQRNERTSDSSDAEFLEPDSPSIDSKALGEFSADISASDWSVMPESGPFERSGKLPGGSAIPFQDFASRLERCLREGIPAVVGEYDAVRRIGAGGMGIVFEARRQTSGERVALKLLHPDLSLNHQAWLRFQKEARVWRTIQGPHVVRLLGFESSAGQPFLVTELVNGMSLASWLEQNNRLSESVGLRLFEQVAQGLHSIHQAGVIHRDLKPSNILLLMHPENSRTPSERAIVSAKLTDFGLAREIEQSESMELTQTRALLGTPRYLAPEQFSDRPTLGPTSDLYALGVTMFQAFTGQSPFEPNDLWELADQHRFLPPPDPQSLNRELSNSLRIILLRLLEKQPEDRYQNVDELLTDLDLLKNGKPVSRPLQFLSHPETGSGGQTIEFRWELRSPVKVLWPLVTQTNRVNRAMGLPAPEFRPISKNKPSVYDTKAKLKGMTLHWNEYPFCWVECQSMTVLREFHNGPYRLVVSEVELVRLIHGGTLLIHRFHYQCRNRLGRWFARWQIGKSTWRSLDRIYRGLDEHGQISSNHSRPTDGFTIPVQFARNYQAKVSQLNRLLAEQDLPETIRARLEELILEGPDDELARLRVRALARRWQVAEAEVLRAMLCACQVGVLNVAWEVICPKCRAGSSHHNQLAKIKEHEHCEVCHIDFETHFAQNVELIFEVTPAIRKIARQRWCIGGPFHAPHVVAQLVLQNQQTISLKLALEIGDYQIINSQSERKILLQVRDKAENSAMNDRLKLNLNWNFDESQIFSLVSGGQRISITNETNELMLIRLERVVSQDDVLTAAEAATFRIFRETFPNQIVSPQTLLSLDHASFLAVKWQWLAHSNQNEAKNQLDIMARISRDVVPVIQRMGGELVDTGEDLLLSMFRDERAAELCYAVLTQNFQSPEHPLARHALRMKIQSGPVVVSHLLGFPKYLGKTIESVLHFEEGE